MVSLKSNPAGLLLQDIFAALSAKIRQMSADTIEYAFSAWLYPPSRSQQMPVLPLNPAVNNYSHVAQIAFLLEIDSERNSDLLPILIDGLQRTASRSPMIVGVGPAAFYNDAIALFGLALGARRADTGMKKNIAKWMRSFIPNSVGTLPPWKQSLMAAALFVLEDNTVINFDHTHASEMELALYSRGINCFSPTSFDRIYQAVCNGAIREEGDIAFIAARLQSIDYLMNHLPAISINMPTIPQVVQVLSNLTPAFRRWVWEDSAKTKTSAPQKWDVQNEYHVQSLLYFILAPLFPDLEDEFYLETTGQLNPRADIGLPSINLIIEVKYLRQGKSFQKMLEEIAADATLYFKKESVYKDKYNQMLVFLWDDSNRTHDYGIFRNGVRSFNNISDVVVMARPGVINRSPANLKATKKGMV
ncbi:PD-(D/E)XK nuclease domain-containing protein [Parapedobacter koreensis]|uniref:Uncharacterized protein n=1 Tax=Parapedobacter koreensis TaxID=332977 RepID=A0A1H7K2F9_9SPHI|nr:hypothetical protein [Parapedobacter koreensis]SEK81063.1 hypothetical protein SAMN05421740_102762 [Parapedobacter koreensis]